MRSRAWWVVLCVAAVGLATVAYRAVAPSHYDSTAGSVGEFVSGAPEPLVIGATVVVVLAVWVSVLLVLARTLYWGWKQVDSYVWRVWDLLLPESTIVRFAAGVTIMLMLLVLAPLAVLQAADLIADGEDVGDQVVGNETGNATAANDSPANETSSAYSVTMDHPLPSIIGVS